LKIFPQGVTVQLSEDIRRKVILFQQTEITEYHIYKRLARRIKSQENAKILDQIAEDELRHYNGWKQYSGEEVPRFRIHLWCQAHGAGGGNRTGELRNGRQGNS
jgi:uncharacterized protein (DUF2126 family)